MMASDEVEFIVDMIIHDHHGRLWHGSWHDYGTCPRLSH